MALSEAAARYDQAALVFAAAVLGGRYGAAQRWNSWSTRVLDTEVPDVEDLWYPEERTDVTDWLREHGWDASAITMSEMLIRYGRNVPGDDVLPPTVFVSAQRS